MVVSTWYFGSRESFYFDLIKGGRYSFQRFKIIVKPDLSDATLHVMNMSEIFLEDSMGSFHAYIACDDCRICDDAVVYFWHNSNWNRWGTYTGLTSAPFTNIITRLHEQVQVQSLCPSSGRIVYYTDDRRLVVVDLF